MIKIVEVTNENESQYLEQIAELEQIVMERVKTDGREGQIFATGKADISEYVHSDVNTVLVATDENGQVGAATYVTQGQKPFTYNDITKYFKYGEAYKQYVKAQYPSEAKYQMDMLKMYTIKIKAFEYARERILAENPQVGDMRSYLRQEIAANGLHEPSPLREKLNRYMSEFIERNFGREIMQKYEQFYWTTANDILEETGRQCNLEGSAQAEYDEIMRQQKFVIHGEPDFDVSKYYSSNTSNAVELDTYITAPDNRNAGTARILVFEGIKKHINRHFQNSNNEEIFLCSTVHKDNYESKYVSEFFGLTDNLYVERRQGANGQIVNREVHICRIGREQAIEYLAQISDKLAVLYGYNPNQKQISSSTRIRILKEQLEYERKQVARLRKARATDKTFSGVNVKFIEGKAQKVKRLESQIAQIEEENKGEQ